jgi:DNA polymerase-1
MLVAIDFETGPILPRPEYPPVPVGVAIYEEHKDPFYLAWGHPAENNCTFEEARGILYEIWMRRCSQLVFHNAQFDVDVAETHMGMPELPWHQMHCTQIMAFLAEPEAKSTALKVLAEEHLGMEPDEQTELFEWIKANVPEAKRKKKVGAWIGQTPGKMCGKYAIGDVVRTLKLFDHFSAWIKANNVTPAYERERKLVRTVLAMERRGVQVNPDGVAESLADCERGMEIAQSFFDQVLGGPINVMAKEALADRLEELGYVEPTAWHRTWTGRRQTSHESLAAVMPKRRTMLSALRYYSLMKTIHDSMAKWGSGDRMYCQWNTTRRSSESKTVGARTGRLSSSPNFQNIPARIPKVANDGGEADYLAAKGGEVLLLPGYEWRHAPCIPHPREHIVAPEGYALGCRDYSQQELRILAHFAGHGLARRYRQDPDTDMHSFAQEELMSRFGIELARGKVKTLGFGLLYGQSVGATAAELGEAFETTQTYRRKYLEALDGVVELQTELKSRAANDTSFRTWGGRLYWCEEPAIVQGKYRTFEYKMLNTLIQGSAGDHMKETLVRAHDAGLGVVVTVHDEVLFEAPEHCIKEADREMEEIMEGIQFKVPMRSDGKVGENWEVCK